MHLNEIHVPIKTEIDTGASGSIISLTTYHRLRRSAPLELSDTKLKTCSGVIIDVLGSTKVKVRCNNDVCELSVSVADGDGPNLMGQVSHFHGVLKSNNAIHKLITYMIRYSVASLVVFKGRRSLCLSYPAHKCLSQEHFFLF